MKKIVYPVLLVLFCCFRSFGTIHTVTNSGFTFVPDSISIVNGDTVKFVLDGIHDVVEVSESTWNANEATPLGEGFSTPFGGGIVVPSGLGIHYYVCEPHAPMGMKGRIVVNSPLPNTINISSFIDQDGNIATTGDQIAKPWKLYLYQDSVGSGIILDSALSASTLNVNNLSEGTYVAVEADSAQWSHLSINVNGVSQGVTSVKQKSFTVTSGDVRSVDFINYAPYTVINSGFTFVPESLAVPPGAIVHFVLDPMHTAREVSKSTWLANDTVSNGGFNLSYGGGTVVTSQSGLYYYMCVPHASVGMKGRLFVGALTISNSVMARWNMISLPLKVSDSAVGAVYPTAVSPAYDYEVGYVTKSSLSVGLGYWLKFNGAQTVLMNGFSVNKDSFNVVKGWNMIGSISVPVLRTSISSSPSGIISSVLYGYHNGYYTADTVKSGAGYWVRVSQAGKLILGTGPVASPKTVGYESLYRTASRLVFRDAAAKEQTLYFVGDRVDDGNIRSWFDMPPVPPMGGFDVRFASGSFVELLNNEGARTFPIQISSAEYPVNVQWNMHSPADGLSLNLDGKRIPLSATGEVNIERAGHMVSLDVSESAVIPASFALYETYPNPFNPVTAIRYQMPVDSRVRVIIYNLLGQIVAVLTDGVQEAGVHSVTWNAVAEASGVYFVQLNATATDGSGKSFVDTKKIMLQK